MKGGLVVGGWEWIENGWLGFGRGIRDGFSIKGRTDRRGL